MGTKISALTALTTADDADVLPIVDVSASATKKITWANLKAALSNIGKTQRAQFTYKDADEIYADAGHYDCDGKIAYWSSQLTIQLSGAGANTTYYLYLDYSAITSGTVLTASEFLFSSTAPTWTATKHGWYNGSDRCIFAVRTDGSNNIREFFHSGELVIYANHIEDRVSSALSTSWTDVVLSIPAFCTRALVKPDYYALTSGGFAYWRTNGQTGTTGHQLGFQYYSGAYTSDTQLNVITDSSQTIELKLSAAGTIGLFTDGWFFPVGI